jgi:hypothetical protein
MKKKLVVSFVWVLLSAIAVYAQLPYSCPKTLTYYAFTVDNSAGTSYLGNEPYSITLNADQSLTVHETGETFAYSGCSGGDHMWLIKSDGSCYRMSADGSVFAHVVMWTFFGTTSVLLRTIYTATPMSSGRTSVIPSGGNAGSSGGSSGYSSQPVSKSPCPRCGGCGYVIEYATNYGGYSKTKYCKECRKEVPYTHYHQTCPSCKGTGLRQ